MKTLKLNEQMLLQFIKNICGTKKNPKVKNDKSIRVK